MKKIIVLSLCSILNFISFAQDAPTRNAGSASKANIEGKYLGFRIPKSDDVELLPEFSHVPSKNEGENQPELEKLKEEKMKLKLEYLKNNPSSSSEASQKTRGTIDPVVEIGFNALGASGVPSDNTIAINKSGQIIAMVNSSMRTYNSTSGAGIGAAVNTDNFFNSLGTGLNTCDPKVIFDQESDRFIAFSQTCDGSSTTSALLLAFSKTADPTQGWFFYEFTGNLSTILGVSTWFDYPKIAVSNHDVFITGNLFDNNEDYVQSVVYQIDKIKCYAGSTLVNGDALVWTNIASSPFTMVPMSNGQSGGYGNNMYLVSNDKGSIGGGGLLIYEITNAVQSSPNLTDHFISISGNSSPTNAVQKGTTIELMTGDSRGMDGFYLNGTIHFVFHADVGSGFAGINYYRLQKSGSNWVIQNSKVIKITGVDCAFPSIASMGWNSNDQSAIIGFNYSSNNDFPGMKAVFVDHNNIASAIKEVKTGTGYADLTSSNETRWGDYSGMTRVLNATKPTAWCFGMFGNTSHSWTNHFAKITTQAWPTATNNVTELASEVSVYPNPIIEDYYKVKLDLIQSGKLEIKLLDMNGKFLRDVFEVHAVKGQNLFSFNKGSLATGNYIVNMTLDNKIIRNEKISIVR